MLDSSQKSNKLQIVFLSSIHGPLSQIAVIHKYSELDWLPTAMTELQQKRRAHTRHGISYANTTTDYCWANSIDTQLRQALDSEAVTWREVKGREKELDYEIIVLIEDDG